MPTVTLQHARPGRTYVQVGDIRFPIGEPVRDVDQATLDRLKAVPGVAVHVAPGAKKSQPDDSPEKE